MTEKYNEMSFHKHCLDEVKAHFGKGKKLENYEVFLKEQEIEFKLKEYLRKTKDNH